MTHETTQRRHSVRCCVVGGGPAGMMLGFLLARAGIEVAVLEKHEDFLRDFRGDTIHPSTLELMHELGLIDQFLALPHEKARTISAIFGGREYAFADFSHLPTRSKFIALMPQWDFLNFLAEQGRRYPAFEVRLGANVTGILTESGRVVGVRAETPEGPLEVAADLVVAADGRHSTVRDAAGLEVEDIGAPMDVLWFRLSRRDGDPTESMGRFEAGRILILIDRGDYWQCAYLIAKGTVDATYEAGLPAFHEQVATSVPEFAGRVGEIDGWDKVKLLTVTVNRLASWHRPGVLFIGDAAHAMSPIGGVGVNLAVQDAVAAANILYEPLRAGRPSDADLARVQKRREFPTRVTQAMQVFLQKRVIDRMLGADAGLEPPLPLRLTSEFAPLRRIPARLIGIGVRPEHVRTPEATMDR